MLEDLELNEETQMFGDEVVDVDNTDRPHIPCPSDVEWDDYVLGHFDRDKEFFNGNPTVDGLRRVTEKLIGEIIESNTEIVSAPQENNKWATARVEVVIYTTTGQKRFSGCADACYGNTDKPYNKYLVAMAETRAEGRALRRALKLKVVAAEELSEVALKDEPVAEVISDDGITANQINFIDFLCRNDARGLNINVQKLVNKAHPEVHNIKVLTHADSLGLQKTLAEYQQTKDKIPEDIRGYDSGWKDTFC